MKRKLILGIHASFTANTHDPSICLIDNGKIIFAAEEERFNRNKSSLGLLPYNAINSLLEDKNISIKDIDLVVSTGTTNIYIKKKIINFFDSYFGYCPKVLIVNHAMSHAYGTFLSSGFEKSLVISIDGIGDKISTLVANGARGKLKIIYKSSQIDESLGLFYGVFTNFLGFKRSEGEFKLMGMAALGKKKYNLDKYITIKKPFKISLNKKIYIKKFPMTTIIESLANTKYLTDKNLPHRNIASNKINQNHFDLAYAVQKKYEEIFEKIIIKFKSNHKSICISGGCALNCLANRILEKHFKNIYIMPASSDRGLSIGNAYIGAIKEKMPIKKVQSMFLGNKYNESEIKKILINCNVKFRKCNSSKEAVKDILNGKTVGWFKGRSEFGPRALGGRSIIAYPQIKNIKDKLNKKIKFREPYRPYAPAILTKYAKKIGIYNEYPYMTLAIDLSSMIKKNPVIKKIFGDSIHYDNTTRLLTVKDIKHPFYEILSNLEKRNKAPIIINTSFNLSGEPIVETPRDALRTFFSSGLDSLYIENFKIFKS